MRPVTVLLFSALSLASIAACAPTTDYQKTALMTCPQLEGYPDCPAQSAGSSVEVAAAPAESR
jgi:hypothetical protein